MATIIDWSQVRTKIDSYEKLYDCETKSIALAYIILEYELKLSPDDIRDAITDGGNDRGIDAVVIDSHGDKEVIHLFQVKYTSKFEDADNHFPSTEIDKILSFIADLSSRSNSLSDCNPILWQKVQDIWAAFDRGAPTFVIHFCSNRSELISTEYKRIVSSLAPYRIYEIRQHTLSSIASMIIKSKLPNINREIHLVDKQYFERVDGNIRGLIATIQAKELIELIRDPNDQNKVLLDIFNDNVRVYLSSKNQINQKIIDSALSDQNAEFWYLNNGITITCDSLEYPPGVRHPLLRMKNIQIVNGGQTSNALFEANITDSSKLEDVLVLVKIYETKNSEISQKIAESTNRQTPIRTRDLRANDEIQKKLEEEFLDLGYFYERKVGQYIDKDRLKRIDATIAGQAHLSYINEFPDIAYREKGKVFGDLYDSIFNNDIPARRLLIPFQLFSKLDARKRELQSKMRHDEEYDKTLSFLLSGVHHVLFTIGYLCERKNLDKFDYDVASSQMDQAIDVVRMVVQQEEVKIPQFSFGGFFKDRNTKEKIETRVIKILMTN